MKVRPARVLVIDDDADTRLTIEWLLKSEGFEVFTAADGAEGLARLRERPADLVITDLFMPEKDGVETIMELRSRYPATPVLVVSGSASSRLENVMVAARELGVTRYLRKPCEPRELVDAVRELARPVRD